MPRRTDKALQTEIGSRVARLRAERHLTQEELAARVGVQAETISRCETGDTAMAIANLARVAQVFGVGLGDVVDVTRELPSPVETPEGSELTRVYLSMSREAQSVALRLLRDLAETFPRSGAA